MMLEAKILRKNYTKVVKSYAKELTFLVKYSKIKEP